MSQLGLASAHLTSCQTSLRDRHHYMQLLGKKKDPFLEQETQRNTHHLFWEGLK